MCHLFECVSAAVLIGLEHAIQIALNNWAQRGWRHAPTNRPPLVGAILFPDAIDDRASQPRLDLIVEQSPPEKRQVPSLRVVQEFLEL